MNVHSACDAGGLGDVMGALPKALARRGHRVMVVVPRYSNYEEGWETGVRVQLGVGGSTVEVRLEATRIATRTKGRAANAIFRLSPLLHVNPSEPGVCI